MTLMQKISDFLRHRMIARLWLSIVGPIAVITLGIVLVTGVVFNSFLLDSAVSNTTTETQAVADQFGRTYRDILNRMVRKVGSSAFREQAAAAIRCSADRYTVVNNGWQEILNECQQMSNMIQAALVVTTGHGGPQRMVFSSYNYSLRSKSDILDYDLSRVTGMTVLPVTQSPVTNRTAVIPLVVPLQFSGSNLLLICPDPRQADLILYLFLDADTVNDYLSVYCDDSVEGKLYLLNRKGQAVNVPTVQKNLDAADDLEQKLARAVEAEVSTFEIGGDQVFLSGIRYGGLYLANVVPRVKFLTGRDAIYQVLFLIAATSVGVVTAVCSLISVLTTQPLRTLMQIVQSIEDGSYNGHLLLNREDEIGQLEKALNTMDSTIHRQMQDIQQKEQEKFNARMQLLTEQINPHFLYNTLEFINMEVLTGYPENASHMIAALGDYIRISLAYGDNEHTIQRELDQAAAYVDIMSCRFSQPVELLVNVPENLRCRMILKCTVQPLVENCLKHGFAMSDGGVPFAPKIEISITVEETDLVLAVVDNGAGIDIPRAQKILREGCGDSRDRHIGLHNIYTRLAAYYGRADFSFSTLPYFENRIEIRLPARSFLS